MPRQRDRGQQTTTPISLVMVMVLVLVAIVSGPFVEDMSQLNADFEVVNATCDSVGEDANITALTLRVDYHGDEPITVHSHTWDGKRHVQHPWEPRSVRLEPGVQTVEIHSPRPRAGVTPGSRAQVYLNDGQRRAIENWGVRDCA